MMTCAELREIIDRRPVILIWAPGQVVWDDPAAIEETGEAGDMVAGVIQETS